MFTGRAYVVALVALVAAAAFAACGGGGGETVPEGTLVKQEFLRKAEAVCKRSLEELNEADLAAWKKYEPDHTTTDEAVLNKVSLALVPGKEREVRRLRALGLPKGDERYVYGMLQAWEEGLEEAREDPSLIREAGPGTGLYKGSKMASAYGLEGCG
jgi:hypothetical protein